MRRGECAQGTETTKPPPLCVTGASKRCRQRPTLPRSLDRSTIGAAWLNDRVRDGNGCGPSALVASEFSFRKIRWGVCRPRSSHTSMTTRRLRVAVCPVRSPLFLYRLRTQSDKRFGSDHGASSSFGRSKQDCMYFADSCFTHGKTMGESSRTGD